VRLLNRRHAASVGLQGAAAILADQEAGHPYNSQRVAQAFEKHFFQLLFALWQRLALHRLRRQAIEINSEQFGKHQAAAESAGGRSWVAELIRHAFHPPDEDSNDPFQEIHARLLQFGLTGEFAQSQLSESAQDYYELARRGLRLEGAWRETRQVIDEIDAEFETRRSVQSLGALTELQRKIEWVEVAVIGVYVVEATHIVYGESEHGVGTFAFFLAAIVLGTGAAFAALQPHRHQLKGFRWGWLGLLFLLLLTWGSCVRWATPQAGHESESHGQNAHPPAAQELGGGREVLNVAGEQGQVGLPGDSPDEAGHDGAGHDGAASVGAGMDDAD
jgi:hypothetical protein